nr:RNA-directed DNA polymerase, eukaryota, reverse transcriptase zinc-binding domain protein [Tanacetum cinerariifolium]
MSKLDRFLSSEGLMMVFPSLSALCLDRHLSSHRPILLRELNVDYGPILFWVFHSWFSKDGFDKLVEDTWRNSASIDSNSMINLKKKHQTLKVAIKQWLKANNQCAHAFKSFIQNKLFDLDKKLDQGGCNEETLIERHKLLKGLHDLNNLTSLDMAQNVKVHWSIEGDENSKYFHGIINKKTISTCHLWYFRRGERIIDPPKKDDLERNVTQDEIKRAMWECGTNKSPGANGFSFEFIRRTPRGGIEEDHLHLLRSSTSTLLLPQITACWIWSLESSGDFSVQSVRIFIDDSMLPKEEVSTR